jgi:hypothetical protein
MGCPAFIGGLAVLGIWLLPLDFSIKCLFLLWIISFLFITYLYWKKNTVHIAAVTLISIWGAILYSILYGLLCSHSTDYVQVFSGFLCGLIVSATFYAMNLGHFYLNVHGLKLFHLKNVTKALTVLLIIRLLWDIVFISIGFCCPYDPIDSIPIWIFMKTMDGYMLWMALFFGTLFPLGASYFAFGTLKLKNTQATTGILYVILSAVLLGDLVYKYYLLRFGIPL